MRFGDPDADYVSLWAFIETMNYRARFRAGLAPLVEIWEDVSKSGGFDTRDTLGQRIYTRVKILQTTRAPLGPGPLRYQSTVTFYIDDQNYDQF